MLVAKHGPLKSGVLYIILLVKNGSPWRIVLKTQYIKNFFGKIKIAYR